MQVYQEYPKCLYRPRKGQPEPETRIVTSATEEKGARKEGWCTAADFFGYPKPTVTPGA